MIFIIVLVSVISTAVCIILEFWVLLSISQHSVIFVTVIVILTVILVISAHIYLIFFIADVILTLAFCKTCYCFCDVCLSLPRHCLCRGYLWRSCPHRLQLCALCHLHASGGGLGWQVRRNVEGSGWYLIIMYYSSLHSEM